MKLHVFCFSNDSCPVMQQFLQNPNVCPIAIRSIHDSSYFDRSLVLLSYHSSNQKVIRYIRKYNILIPIFIVSSLAIHYKGTNGFIDPNDLQNKYVMSKLALFPQQFIWNYVFHKDYCNRILKFNLT